MFADNCNNYLTAAVAKYKHVGVINFKQNNKLQKKQ